MEQRHLYLIHYWQKNQLGLLQVDWVPVVLMEDSGWKTRMAVVAGVHSLTRETPARRGIDGIALKSPDCLEGIEESLMIRLFLGAIWKIEVPRAVETSTSLREMGLIGKLWGVGLIQQSLTVRL